MWCSSTGASAAPDTAGAVVWYSVRAFQLKVSVDQDLTVVVVALDDDVVKRWLVSIVFHASVTKQRSTGSETRFSRSHVHENKQNPP